MKRANLIFTLIAIGIMVFLGQSYFSKIPKPIPSKTYSNQTYGYSFTYGGSFDAFEYSPAYVAVGTTTKDVFDTIANIDLVTADPGSTESFADFVHRSAMNMCSADGPNASIRCVSVRKSTPIATKRGLQGELFSLAEIKETIPGHATSSRERGPFFAFDISANVPNKKFAALIIHMPIAGEDDTIHISQIEGIIDSLTIAKLISEGSAGEATSSTPVPLVAKIGQKVSVGGVSITPIAVTTDSRCPVDVQCIQAGTVALQIAVRSGLGSATSSISFEQGITTEAEVITLTEVAPAKHAKTAITPEEYSFTFAVSKR